MAYEINRTITDEERTKEIKRNMRKEGLKERRNERY
jgi:hypothetical protein